MERSILDSDILSELIKGRNAQVAAAAAGYLSIHTRLSFSEFTIYEVVRGLLSKRAEKLLEAFLKRVEISDVFPITRPILRRASELWKDAVAGGHPKSDADLIIAATALVEGRTLVTGNTRHYSWITGLKLANWRAP